MPPKFFAALAALLCAVPASALKTETMAAAASGRRQAVMVASGLASLKFSSGTAAGSIDAALAAAGAARAGDLGAGWLSVRWTDGSPVGAKLDRLRALPGVVAAEPSKAYRALRTPNDPLFGAQYALAAVSAPAGWEYEVGDSSRVTIVVVDTGIDGTQPDLTAKFSSTTSYLFDQSSGTAAPNDPPTYACDHATTVAGVAAASTDNGTLVAGLSWGAQLASYKIFDDASCNPDCSDAQAYGSCSASDAAIAGALNAAAALASSGQSGRIVVNMSLGGSGACSAVVQDAISNAASAGVVVVAAAGNDGLEVNSPGNCAGVIPIGATDNANQIASFSSRGPELAASGLVAPGVSILTTAAGGGAVNASGTSLSSPMGAGLAALILSAHPLSTPAQVQALMRAGAQDLGAPATVQGAGLMNVYRSLRLTKTGTLAALDGDVKPIAFPNPFRPGAAPYVNFSYPSALHGGGTDIKIYTMDGGFVRDLGGTPLWDGRNAGGNLVASGSYVFEVKSSNGSARGRLAVVR